MQKPMMKLKALFTTVIALAVLFPAGVRAEDSPGLEHLDDAMRAKINATGLQDLNQVIDLLQKSLDKGLDEEDTTFAESMMSDALMQRASSLVRVINAQSIGDKRVQQIFRLVVSDLRRILAFTDPPAEAHFMLGKLMGLPGGDPHEARRQLTTFLETEGLPDSQKAEAYVHRARLQTNEAKALADFGAALELEPGNSKYQLVRAVYLRSRKKLDEALAEISVILDGNPTDVNALLMQGEVLRETGNNEAAQESFERAAEISPESLTAHQRLGEIYRTSGDYEKALTAFDKILEIKPEEVLTRVHRAEVYLRSNRLEEALADVDMVLKKQPLVLAHRIRAEVLANMDRLDEAIEEIERVSLAMPANTEMKIQLALYYQIDRQNEKAIDIYTEILEQESDNTVVRRTRGDAYLTQGDHAAAIADFEKALEELPEDAALLNNLAWVLATSPEDELRDGKRAVELATKACEVTEYKQAHILSTLAAAFAESGDFDTAIEWSEKAVEMGADQEAQLTKELASYRGGEPWRERQSADESKPTPEVDASLLEEEAEKLPAEVE